MKRMGAVLDRLTDRYRLKQSLKEHSVFAVWDRAVGESIAAHARPVSIREGRLLVHVSDSAHQTHYQFSLDDLRQKLNRLLGRAVIKSIQLRVGELPPPAAVPVAESPPPRATLLEAGALAAIEEAVAVIKDEEIRDRVRRYLMAAAQPADRTERGG